MVKVIFVVGNSRSGTTMMGRILNKNSKIFTLSEIHFFGELWSKRDLYREIPREEAVKLLAKLIHRKREGYLKKENLAKYWNEAIELIDQIGDKCKYLHEFYKEFLMYETQKHGKQIPCEQTPRNLFYLQEIFSLFPGAKVINMIRDPRSVLLSQKYKWKRRFLGAKNIPLRESMRAWINYHPITISKLWNSSINAAFVDNRNIIHVKYEILLNNPEQVIKDICSFLGVDFDYQMLEIPIVGSSVTKNNSLKIGIDKDRAKSWTDGGLTSTEIFICQKITGKKMKTLGYQSINVKPNIFLLVWFCFIFPFKLILSFVINLKRMKNIKENIEKRLWGRSENFTNK